MKSALNVAHWKIYSWMSRMINLIRAEMLKLYKNMPISMLLIGAIPALAFALLNVIAITTSLGFLTNPITTINGQEQVILALLLVNQVIAQTTFIILSAITFGGESTWKTWKNILPRNRRRRIIFSKFIILIIAITLTIHLTALLTYIGSWEYALLTESSFINGAWNDIEISFWTQYFVVTACLLFTYTLGAIYASIASIQTQSISAGIVLGVIIALADIVSQPAFTFISRLLRLDFIAEISGFLPNYNIQNILSWITTGAPVYRWNVATSTVILIVWALAGIGLAIYLFEHRDIE